MKIKWIFLIFVTFLGSFLGNLYSGKNQEKLQQFHQQIGNKLLQVKNENPNSQSLVYSLLDQFGKYYSFSKSILTKKREYKKLLKSEMMSNELLKKDLIIKEDKIKQMKKVLLAADQKIQNERKTIACLEEEKEALRREKEKFNKKQEAFKLEKEKLLTERDSLIRERDQAADKSANESEEQRQKAVAAMFAKEKRLAHPDEKREEGYFLREEAMAV